MYMTSIRRQRGSIVAFVICAIAGAAILATVAFTGYFQITKSAAATGNAAQSRALLSQAGYSLTTLASDADSDGFPEAPAMDTGGTAPMPAGGGLLAASVATSKVDSWGVKLGYCSWDNGSTASSTGRIAGDNPASQSSVVFAVLSAGPNKVFDTSCAQARLSQKQKDDRLVVYTVGQIVQGVGGTAYLGDPVADSAALAALNTTALVDGQIRLQKDTDQLKRWNQGSGSWTPVAASGGGGNPRNYLINGNFNLWQRGISAAASNAPVNLADRWLVNGTAAASYGIGKAATYSQAQQVVSPADGLPLSARYALRVNRTNINTLNQFSGAADVVTQRIEGVATLAGMPVSASFWVKADADRSFCADFMQYYGTSGGSPGAMVGPIGQTCYTATTAWQKITITTTLPVLDSAKIASNPVGDGLFFRPVTEVSDGSARASTFSVWIAQAQVQAGSSLSAFEIMDPSLEMMLARRYYETGYIIAASMGTYSQAAGSYRVTKRVFPTVTYSNIGIASGCTNATTSTPVTSTIEYAVSKRDANAGVTCSYTDMYRADAEMKE